MIFSRNSILCCLSIIFLTRAHSSESSLENGLSPKVSNQIIDTKGIDKRGNDTLLLSDDLQYTGNTILREGTLQLGNNNAIPHNTSLTIENGTLDMDNNSIAIDTLIFNSGSIVQGTGILVFEQTSGPALIMRNTTIPGNIIIEDPNGSVYFDATNAGTAQILGNIDLNAETHTFAIEKGTSPIDMKISGVISNGGITKEGLGTLELTGKNSYIGQTTIALGTLAVNGSFHNTPVVIDTLGILQGTGTIGKTMTTVTNNGQVSPGNSIGTLIINGSYVQNALGRLTIEIENASSYDRLIVNGGSVSLDGSLLVDFLGDFSLSLSDQITFIDNTTGTGISGTFTQIVSKNLHPAFLPVITYNSNTVILSFQEQTSPLESFPSFSKNIFSLIDTPLIFLSRHLECLRQTLLNRHKHNSKDTKDYAMAFPMEVDPEWLMAKQEKTFEPISKTASKKNCPFSIYIGRLGSFGETDSVKSQEGYDSWSGGGLLGFDATYDYLSWGIVASYERLKTKIDHHWGKFAIDAVSLNSYGSWSPACSSHYFLDWIGGMGYEWQDINRNAYFSIPKSSCGSFSGNALLGTGYLVCHDHLTWIPKLSLQYMGFYQDEFSEKQGGLQNLFYDKQTGQSLRPTFTLSFVRSTYPQKAFCFLPEFHARYQRELLNPNATLQYTGATLTGKNSLTLIGGGRDYVYVGGSLQVKREKLSLEGSYDFEWNRRYKTHYYYVGGNYQF